MNSMFLPTTREIGEMVTVEVVAAGGLVSDCYEDGRRVFSAVDPARRAGGAARQQTQGGVAVMAADEEVCVRPYVFRQVCANGAIMAWALETRSIQRAGPDATAYEVEEVARPLRKLRPRLPGPGEGSVAACHVADSVGNALRGGLGPERSPAVDWSVRTLRQGPAGGDRLQVPQRPRLIRVRAHECRHLGCPRPAGPGNPDGGWRKPAAVCGDGPCHGARTRRGGKRSPGSGKPSLAIAQESRSPWGPFAAMWLKVGFPAGTIKSVRGVTCARPGSLGIVVMANVSLPSSALSVDGTAADLLKKLGRAVARSRPKTTPGAP